MVHSNTELLTDYWRRRLPSFGSPPRSSIDPGDFADLLPQIFMLGRIAPGRYALRLVGAMVEQLHDRSLRREDFLSLWSPADRASLQSAIEGAGRRSHPLVVLARGRTAEGHSIDLEVMMAPIAGAAGEVDRFLGLYQPLTAAAALRGGLSEPLLVRQIGLVGDAGEAMAEAPRLRLAAMDGRRIA